MRVSMKDVAHVAGVSLGTVSNVLNRPEIVAEATRARVQKVIHELGFVVNASAQTLRAGRTKLLGLLVPDIGASFSAATARGVDDAAFAAGYAVILCNTDGDAAKEMRYLDLLVSQHVAGILIATSGEWNAAASRLIDRDIAITLLNRPSVGVQACSVAVDEVLGGAMAFDHLYSLGHREVVVLLGPVDLPTGVEHKRGYLEAADRHRSEDSATLHFITASDVSTAGGEACMLDFLNSHSRTFTAVLCANDLLALGAMRSLRAKGIAVPQEVSVIGYEDIDYAASAQIPLTSVRQPQYQLGYAATELVIAACEDPAAHVHQHVTLPPEVVPRDSTRAVDRAQR